MLSSFTFSSRTRAIIRRLALFTAGLLAMFIALIAALSNIKIDGLSLLQMSSGNYAVTGDVRGSLRRFREIETVGEVDIIFVGSSHSYASFDSRVFTANGLTSFNMGTPSQTPLNTFYLLKRYLAKLNPKLVVYEIYHPNLAGDGLESFYDLAANQAPSTELLSMALATKNPQALNDLCARLIESITGNGSSALQLVSPHLTYLPGGFVAHNTRLEDTLFGEPEATSVNETQWDYVQDILKLLQGAGVEALVVVTPMPSGKVNTLTNYARVSERIAELCASESVTYYDFNTSPTLQAIAYYADYHHLNTTGAGLFSAMIADSLRTHQIFASLLSLTPLVARR